MHFFKRKMMFKTCFFIETWENYRGKQCVVPNGFSFVAKYFIILYMKQLNNLDEKTTVVTSTKFFKKINGKVP